MKPDTQRFSSFWQEQSEPFLERFVNDLRQETSTSYQQAPIETLKETSRNYIQAWLTALNANDPAVITDYINKVTLTRIEEALDVADLMVATDVFRKNLWHLMGQLYKAGDWDMDVVELLEHWLHEVRKKIIDTYNQHFKQATRRLNDRERALEDQSRLIQELSVPIVPIHEGILVLPLVGAVDSRRASQIMESALEQIVVYQADVLILDITGVPVVDTGVANYILQMARAVTLLGSKVVLVGIGAEIAQTIVQLGVELNDITTLANLQAGIAYALAQQGFQIAPTGTLAKVS